MRIKHTFYSLCLGTTLLFPPGLSHAQTVAELQPTGQWLINSTGMQGLDMVSAGVKAPCIMANQFNNGFILRISGGGQQLLSLSLDFRQNAFNQGDTYGAVLSVDGGQSYNLMGTAFSPGILIFGLREAGGLYASLQTGRSMALNVAGNTIIFSLGHFREGLHRLESCFSPPSMQSQPAQKVAGAPLTTQPNAEIYIKRQAYPEFKQPSAQDLLKAEADTGPVLTDTDIAADSQPAAPKVLAGVAGSGGTPALPPLTQSEMASLDLSEEDLMAFNAQTLKPVENGMGLPKVNRIEPPKPKDFKKPEPASVPPVEAAPVEPPVVSEVAKVEPRAVGQVNPKAVNKPQVQQVASVTPPEVPTVDTPRISTDKPKAQAELPSPVSEPMRWEAKAGEDIRIVLARWAERAGTDLVWQADNGGKIAQDVAVKGSFEEAVKQVMADNATAMGLRGQFAQGERIEPIPAKGVSKMGQAAALNETGDATDGPTPLTPDAAMPQGEWKANKGDDLKIVLQAWASKNNVALDWKADEAFKLGSSVTHDGDFASALEAALIQFDEETVRPVGHLNRDPNTGQLSLTIETDRAS